MGPMAAVVLLLVSCAPRTVFDQDAIRAALAAQQTAWNAGDIPGFMAYYADTVCFTSPRGTTCGREKVMANYLRSYPDKAAMGSLVFGLHEVLPAGAQHAWVTGTWALHRTADTLSGGFSLLWVEGPGGWRIARDHTW